MNEIERARYKELRDIFAARWPLVFGNRHEPLPLKIGIREDMRADLPAGVNEDDLDLFLRPWTHRREYGLMCWALRQRFDLDGKPTGPVDPANLGYVLPSACRVMNKMQAKDRDAVIGGFSPATHKLLDEVFGPPGARRKRKALQAMCVPASMDARA